MMQSMILCALQWDAFQSKSVAKKYIQMYIMAFIFCRGVSVKDWNMYTVHIYIYILRNEWKTNRTLICHAITPFFGFPERLYVSPKPNFVQDCKRLLEILNSHGMLPNHVHHPRSGGTTLEIWDFHPLATIFAFCIPSWGQCIAEIRLWKIHADPALLCVVLVLVPYDALQVCSCVRAANSLVWQPVTSLFYN